MHKKFIRTLFVILGCAIIWPSAVQAGPSFSREKGDYDDSWFDLNHPTYKHVAKVSRFRVRSGAFVDSIEFWGIDASGKEFSLGEHCGGVGGGCNDVTLRADEFIMGFSGHNGRILDQITIKTNKGKYGPYGGVNGARPFTIHLECPLRVWKAHARGHGKDFVVEWFHCGDGLNEIQEIVPN